LPSYGCCDLGPIILTKFVKNPFGFDGEPVFDFDKFTTVVKNQVRFLDNVLDLTYWPLPEQKDEANQKRRIGVGFTGLGDALIMLRLAYNEHPARLMAQEIARCMRDAAYEASIELAKTKGKFPLFDVDKYLNAPGFASRLPEKLKVTSDFMVLETVIFFLWRRLGRLVWLLLITHQMELSPHFLGFINGKNEKKTAQLKSIWSRITHGVYTKKWEEMLIICQITL